MEDSHFIIQFLRKPIVIASLLFLVLVYFVSGQLNHAPMGIHAWAQADYYAMAQRFYMDSWNLFEAQTWVLNKQFPYEWGRIMPDGVTSGNIAIHPYLVGMCMRLFGTDNPMIYRVYCLAWAFVLIYYVIKIMDQLEMQTFFRWIIGGMVVFAPVFMYYSTNFLNAIPCLAQMFIGVYFYLKYLDTEEKSDWNKAVLILGILPIFRTTFLLVFIAVLCNEGLMWLAKRKTFKELIRQFLIVLIPLALIVIWKVWDKHLFLQKDGIFLSELMQVRSWNEFKEGMGLISEYWTGQYFLSFHYYVMAFIIVLGLFVYRKDWFRPELSFAVIYLIGNICFFFAMFRQYFDHDYYYLETIFPALLLLTIIAISGAQFILRRYKVLFGVVVLGFFILSFNKAKVQYADRTNLAVHDAYRFLYECYDGADAFLTNQGIGREEKIFVLSNMAPNIQLTYIKRPCVIARKHVEDLFATRGKDIQYFLISRHEMNEHFESVLVQLTPIAKWNDLVLLKYNEGELTPLEDLKSY